jgi:hypothetical protein
MTFGVGAIFMNPKQDDGLPSAQDLNHIADDQKQREETSEQPAEKVQQVQTLTKPTKTGALRK